MQFRGPPPKGKKFYILTSAVWLQITSLASYSMCISPRKLSHLAIALVETRLHHRPKGLYACEVT